MSSFLEIKVIVHFMRPFKIYLYINDYIMRIFTKEHKSSKNLILAEKYIVPKSIHYIKA